MNCGSPPPALTPQMPLGEVALGRSRYHTWLLSGDQKGWTQQPPDVNGLGRGGGVLVAVGTSVGAAVTVAGGSEVGVATTAPCGTLATVAVAGGGVGEAGGALPHAANIRARQSISAGREVMRRAVPLTARP